MSQSHNGQLRLLRLVQGSAMTPFNSICSINLQPYLYEIRSRYKFVNTILFLCARFTVVAITIPSRKLMKVNSVFASGL
ncbi:hypothetical protein SAMN05216387_101112 [Nitrosovibrio tenuis]|uniref:Uncharacterized protein n=1 Tax=Nitrosovibrio tenuis TaxID=1233 RepID=A0A1H7FXG6_9PROT|nr:hypothetical protein SAMN05216387_101112 [Nitrosovibrio tenuis]